MTLRHVAVYDNDASGIAGVDASTSRGTRHAGGNGSNGAAARGGGIYLASGQLTLISSSLQGNGAEGGNGGFGSCGTNKGANGTGGATPHAILGAPGGAGGNGGNGGSAEGGGIYVANGQVNLISSGSTQGVSGNAGQGRCRRRRRVRGVWD